jgi:uncharacterized coiled-coil DUF342 family protein
MRDLRDIYNDSNTKKLEEIETLQMNNPTSPDWETTLIEKIKQIQIFLIRLILLL